MIGVTLVHVLGVIIFTSICLACFYAGKSSAFNEVEDKLWKTHYSLGFKQGEEYGRWSQMTGQSLKLNDCDQEMAAKYGEK